MKIQSHLPKSIVISLCTLGLFSAAKASEEAVWKLVGTYSQGVGNIRPMNGGEWVYAKEIMRAGTPLGVGVVVLGSRTQPDEVQFFSSQEEKALWEMGQRMVNDKATLAKAGRQRSAVHLAWPKVVVTELEICVPDFQFAIAVDWKSHLVCTSRAQ